MIGSEECYITLGSIYRSRILHYSHEDTPQNIGSYLDPKLTHSKHIDKTVAKISNTISILKVLSSTKRHCSQHIKRNKPNTRVYLHYMITYYKPTTKITKLPTMHTHGCSLNTTIQYIYDERNKVLPVHTYLKLHASQIRYKITTSHIPTKLPHKAYNTKTT